MKTRLAGAGAFNRITLAVFLVLIVLPIAVYGLSIGNLAQAAPGSAVAPVARPTVVSLRAVPIRATSGNPRLQTIQYLELRNELQAIVAAQDPRAALQRIGKLIAVDPAVARSCHALLHDIGHAGYLKYHDFARAVAFQDDICGSGYLHGIVEERLQHSRDVYGDLQTLCSSYANSGLGGKCYHGVGHGLMTYTGNNLPLAVQMCGNYASDFARLRCAEGVFMENFNTDQKVHPSQYVRASDPAYPCADQLAFYKDPCYFYAPIYYLDTHDRDFLGAMRWCGGAEPGYVGDCITGLGSRLMKQNMTNPRFAERTCVRGGPGRVAACIDGMVSYWMVNFDSLSQGRALCRRLQPQNRDMCRAAVTKRQNLFSN